MNVLESVTQGYHTLMKSNKSGVLTMLQFLLSPCRGLLQCLLQLQWNLFFLHLLLQRPQPLLVAQLRTCVLRKYQNIH